MSKRARPCSVIGCHHLKPCPVPGHTRDENQRWSPDRDPAIHARLRRYIIKTRGEQCERDPSHPGPFHMHHVRPGDLPTDVVLLCAECHREVDRHAR